MKKLLLLSLAAVMGMTLQAQQLPAATQLSHPMKRQDVTLTERVEKALFAAKKAKKVSAKAEAPLVDQPAGVLFDNMYVTSEAYGLGWGDIYYQEVDGGYGAVVVGDDGCLYINGPLSQAYVWGLGYPWIKCEKVEGQDGVYEMTTPQAYALDYGDLYFIERLKYDADLESYVVDETNNKVRFSWKDNTLTQLDDCFVGLCDETHDWFYMADSGIKYEVNNDKVVEIPADYTEGGDMRMTYKDDPKDLTSESDCIVTVVASEDDEAPAAYFKGLEKNLPEAAVMFVGNQQTQKFEIPTCQYLGVDMEYNSHMYLLTGDAKVVTTASNYTYFNYDKTTKLEMGYDEEKDAMVSEYPASLIVNCGRNVLYIADEFVAPVFNAMDDEPLVPADPEFVSVNEYNSYDLVKFTVPTVSVDGEDLNTNKLTWVIYRNNEVQTFSPEQYPGLDKPTTEFPYDFNDDNFDFYMNNGVQGIFYQNKGYEKLGVQTIYRGGDEENRSNVVWYQPTTGVEGLNADVRTVMSESYYNVAGQKVDANASGMVFKRVVFTDGTIETFKVVK